MKAITTLLACCTFASLAAHSQLAVVEAVQYPAWLERGGNAVPLTPGLQLEARDRLRTGGNARVQLKLAEGSAVKLGENAQFVIERVEDRGVFRASLEVIAGAFRFTTRSVGRTRDVSIKVKHVTAGIRGTDLWGKSTDQRDLVCLLEGSITVGSQGHPTVTLDQPLDFYQKPRDGAPEVAKVDAKQVDEWARETEISTEGAAAGAGGRWRVVAAVKPKRDDAMALRGMLRGAGFPAEVVAKEGYFRVQVVGLLGEPQARALMASLRTLKGVALPTVHEGP
ncbi:MAG: FecR domain-containing protein [Pseudomonadota bacterium]|nr:FecR domain-containing protein [Pseudomonadota bacterium]